FSLCLCYFFFSSRRRHTRSKRDWSSDVCSSDLIDVLAGLFDLLELFGQLDLLFALELNLCTLIVPDFFQSLIESYQFGLYLVFEIGRASCRERVWMVEWGGALK